MAKKKKRLNLAVIITAIVVLMIALLLPGYTKLQDLIAENNRLEERIVGLNKSIEKLGREKERLKNDMLYIEKVAREKLGVVREDEVIIKEKD